MMLSILLSSFIYFGLSSKCEIKTSYLKLYELVIGSRSHTAMNYAIQDFNSRTMKNIDSLFPTLLSKNCSISLSVYNTSGTNKAVLQSGVSMANNFYSDNLTMPIILAMQYSGLSMAVSPVIEAFSLMHLSGFATNPALSDYPSFFRNIASDELSTLALIKLCKKMGWTKIGITHMSSGGAYVSSLTSWGTTFDVEVTAFSFLEDDNVTIFDSVESMEQSGLFIFIIMAYDTDLEIMINAFKQRQMIKSDGSWYPYYFLGYDGWFDASMISPNDKFKTFLSGAIGICQSSFTAFESIFAQTPSLPQALNLSVVETKKLINKYGADNINNMLPYGYDQITTLLLATEIYINRYEDYLNGTTMESYISSIGGMQIFTNRYMDILQNNVSFVGITGDVSYDDNGDRIQGLVAICNFGVTPNGTFEYNTIGFYLDGQQDGVFDLDAIIWNPSFGGMIPLDYYDIEQEKETLSSLKIALFGLAGIICLFSFVFLAYKVLQFCRDFQEHFGDVDGDEEQKLKEKEKRRLFISIITDTGTTVVGLTDYVTDVGSLVSIMLAPNGEYSTGLIVTYFVFSSIASFMSILHLTVTMKNILNCIKQIKTGTLEMVTALTPSSVKSNKSSAIQATLNGFRFQLQLLDKVIHQEATNIFVGLLEDLPFFILNFIAIHEAKQKGYFVSDFMLFSWVINCVSLGYKICTTKSFLGHLQEKANIISSIEGIQSEQSPKSDGNKRVSKKTSIVTLLSSSKKSLTQIVPQHSDHDDQ